MKFFKQMIVNRAFSMMPSAPKSSTTATATSVEIIPGPIPHIVPLITLLLTTVIPTFLSLLLPVMTTISYFIGTSIPILLNAL
jgi:hypothetical protein